MRALLASALVSVEYMQLFWRLYVTAVARGSSMSGCGADFVSVYSDYGIVSLCMHIDRP